MFRWWFTKAAPKKLEPEPEDECLAVLMHQWDEYHCGARSVVLGKKWVLFCKNCKSRGAKNHRWCN